MTYRRHGLLILPRVCSRRHRTVGNRVWANRRPTHPTAVRIRTRRTRHQECLRSLPWSRNRARNARLLPLCRRNGPGLRQYRPRIHQRPVRGGRKSIPPVMGCLHLPPRRRNATIASAGQSSTATRRRGAKYCLLDRRKRPRNQNPLARRRKVRRSPITRTTRLHSQRHRCRMRHRAGRILGKCQRKRRKKADSLPLRRAIRVRVLRFRLCKSIRCEVARFPFHPTCSEAVNLQLRRAPRTAVERMRYRLRVRQQATLSMRVAIRAGNFQPLLPHQVARPHMPEN